MSERSDYSVLVVKAEKAVKGVVDPELRRVAFERVLESMLGSGIPEKHPKDKSSSSRVAPAKRVERKGGPQGYIEELAGEGFFKKPKTIGQVRTQLGNRGHHIPTTSLSGPLQTLCQRKILRRQKITDGKAKPTFAYSEW